ncbi:hypothetical protein NX059_006521 [Plenodomus lindquistii]|nr:hypothetical protein NX059_006521 [Plenodomus lindquistii]
MAPPPNQPTPTPSSANISTRTYIYFTPYPLPPSTPLPYTLSLPHTNPLNLPTTLFEPTSTLVLTTPNNTFVDLRLLKPIHPSPTGTTTPTTTLPNKSEPGRLEWGFAGHSASKKVSIRANDGVKLAREWQGRVTHSVWSHWVDSRYAVGAEIPADEGDMYAVDSETSVEVGWAFHPGLGRLSGHEEMWRDVPVTVVPETQGVAGEGEGKKVSVALRCEDSRAGVRGLVVRVGQFCQGIVMKGSEVTVERWEFDGDEAGDDDKGADEGEGEQEGRVGGWKRTARIGTAFLPCSATFRPRVLAVGGVVRYREFGWDVEEVWEW